MDLFQTPATIESVKSLVDGTVKLSVETQELSPENMAKLFGLARKLGWFVFKESEIQESDLPTEPVEFKDGKTLDERLNGVLFAYHMQKTNDSKTFHSFRRDVYEVLIQRYREKLSELKDI